MPCRAPGPSVGRVREPAEAKAHSPVTAFFPWVHGTDDRSMPVQALTSLQSSHALQTFGAKQAEIRARARTHARTLMESGLLGASGHAAIVFH